jgi:DNA-binding HxlR family transcriptional regulator
MHTNWCPTGGAGWGDVHRRLPGPDRLRGPREPLGQRRGLHPRRARPGPARPLAARIGGIGPKVLNDALRRLEYNGLVQRRRYAQAPPRVDYELTEAGAALIEPMRAMGAWALRYGDAVLAAQDRAGATG